MKKFVIGLIFISLTCFHDCKPRSVDTISILSRYYSKKIFCITNQLILKKNNCQGVDSQLTEEDLWHICTLDDLLIIKHLMHFIDPINNGFIEFHSSYSGIWLKYTGSITNTIPIAPLCATVHLILSNLFKNWKIGTINVPNFGNCHFLQKKPAYQTTKPISQSHETILLKQLLKKICDSNNNLHQPSLHTPTIHFWVIGDTQSYCLFIPKSLLNCFKNILQPIKADRR